MSEASETEGKSLSFDDRDEFLRRPIAEKLISLLLSEAEVSPVVIDGSWGVGKTEFCQKLIQLMGETAPDYKTIYVDAFFNDHANQPLLTLLAAVCRALPDTKRATLIQKAVPALRFGLKTGLRAGVSWLLRQDAADVADDFDDVLRSAGDEGINLAVEHLLNDHIEAEQSIETLRQALTELTEENPIVIFVDELDRCRPDFAVDLLESIKHVFDVKNVQFVLITNSDQLLASINHCYGSAVDSRRYLDKFLGFSFVLPNTFAADSHNFKLVSTNHLTRLIAQSDLLKDSAISMDGVRAFLDALIAANNLSLREVETFAKYAEIYQAITNSDGLRRDVNLGFSLMKCFAIFVFFFRPRLAEQILAGSYMEADVLALFGQDSLLNVSLEEYPSNAEVVAFLVCEAARSPKSIESLSEEDLVSWNHIAAHYFRGSYGFGDENRMLIVSQTIRDLKLTGKGQ